MNSIILKRIFYGILTNCFLLTTGIRANSNLLNNSINTKELNTLINITSEEKNNIKSEIDDNFKKLKISPEVNLTVDTPINIIVQFKQEPAGIDLKIKQSLGLKATLEESNKLVDESHKKFKEQINENLILRNSVKIKREFKFAFNGVSITMPANLVYKLLSLDTVKAVYEDKEIKLDPGIEVSNNII